MTRATRLLTALVAVAPLTSCGFHPLYLPGDSPQQATLASIFVAIIPNRDGQLLRQALQADLEGTGATSPRYTLTVAYGDATEALGILDNNFSTRSRTTGIARWVLRGDAPPHDIVAAGTVRSLDGYDVINNQFLFGDYQTTEIQRRQATALAAQITEELATYFRKHPELT